MSFEAVAMLMAPTTALAVPLLTGRRLAVFAAALPAVVLVAAGATGTPLLTGLRICAIGLALALLAAGLSAAFKRAGQGVVAATFALLIGSIFLMSPAIDAHETRAGVILGSTLSVSPHAAVAAALGRDFLHDDFFYREQDPAPADYRPVTVPWHRGPLIWAALALPFGAFALWRPRRAAG
jgi:hypothetical protein